MLLLVFLTFPILRAGWIQQNSGTTRNLYGVFFVDSLTGWVVGDSGTILFTNDGGNTWNTQSSPVNYPLTAIVMLNDTVGYISVGDTSSASSTGAVLKTVDGGNTWSLIDPGTSNALLDIDFVDENTGWVLGASGSSGATILKTSDGGATWVSQGSSIFGWFYGVNAVSADVAYVTGVTFWPSQMGVIYGTTDGGASWNDQTPGTPPFLREIFFVSSDTGFCVGDQGAIFSTTDAGNTWTSLSGGTNVDFDGIYFVNSQLGYISGGGGTIIKTSDGGVTFNPETTGVAAHLHDIFFVDNSLGWAVGNGGVIIKKVSSSTYISENSNEENEIKIFYKHDEIWISLNSVYGTFMMLKVFDNSGRLVQENLLNIESGLNTLRVRSLLNSGMYIGVIYFKNRFFRNKFFILK